MLWKTRYFLSNLALGQRPHYGFIHSFQYWVELGRRYSHRKDIWLCFSTIYVLDKWVGIYVKYVEH
jgi:hypothetical protein